MESLQSALELALLKHGDKALCGGFLYEKATGQFKIFGHEEVKDIITPLGPSVEKKIVNTKR